MNDDTFLSHLFYASESSKWKKIFWPFFFSFRLLFILDSLPTLGVRPCKTHSSVTM